VDGILLVDKPGGWTSHDVVARVRRLAGQRRIGHTGTLDPMATGLLVLCLGNATRLVEYMTGHDKAYAGEIALGTTTTTDDAEGEVLATRPVPPLAEGVLRGLALQFTGDIEQAPPRFSAIQRGGQRAHAVARRGGELRIEARPVTVHHLELTAIAPERLSIAVTCGAGTYVRSLARDIGEALGCGAHLASLRRERAGRFVLEDAWTLAEVEALAGAHRLEHALLPADEGIIDLEAALVVDETARRLALGQPAPASQAAGESGPLRLYSGGGAFVGIGSAREGELRPVKIFTSSGTFDRGLTGGIMPVRP